MGSTKLMPMINPESSIPELINFIRHSFRVYEYVEVENILVNRENSRKVEIETLVKEVDSFKELVDALENIQSQTMSAKCSLEKKLEMVQRRGDELDKLIAVKEEKIEKLEAEKSDLDKKLVCSSRNCEEMHANLVKMLMRAEESDKLIVEKEETIERLEGEQSDLEGQLAWRSTKCDEMYENLVTISKIEKLTKMRAQELHKLIVEKGEKIEKLEREKSDLQKKLVLSSRKCEELYEENLVKIAEIDQLDRMRTKKFDKLIVEKGEKIEKLEREKSDLQNKLVLSSRNCEELYKEKIEKLESKNSYLAKKLVLSNRKCDEMDKKLVKMGKEIEELRRENDCANKIIEELKTKELESDRAVQELKRENVDALHTINELRVKKMESEKDLNTRISKSETLLAEIFGGNVIDFAMLNAFKNCAAAATENEVEENVEFDEYGLNNLENGQMNSDAEDSVVVSPDVPEVSGDKDLLHSETEEDDADTVVAKSTAIVHENEDERPVVIGSHTRVMQSGGEVAREKTAVPSSSIPAGSVVIEISDSDDETVPSKKRDIKECIEDSAKNCCGKKSRSNSTKPSGLPSSS